MGCRYPRIVAGKRGVDFNSSLVMPWLGPGRKWEILKKLHKKGERRGDWATGGGAGVGAFRGKPDGYELCVAQ